MRVKTRLSASVVFRPAAFRFWEWLSIPPCTLPKFLLIHPVVLTWLDDFLDFEILMFGKVTWLLTFSANEQDNIQFKFSLYTCWASVVAASYENRLWDLWYPRSLKHFCHECLIYLKCTMLQSLFAEAWCYNITI